MFNIAEKDFSRKTRNALARKGIRIIGSSAIAADDNDRYFSAVAYHLDDNGTCRVRRFREVLALAQ